MIETHLLPLDPSVSGPHILGQDSWYKGSRMADAWWDARRGAWHMFGFFYGAQETRSNHWVYVASGTMAENGLADSVVTIALPQHELHPYRG